MGRVYLILLVLLFNIGVAWFNFSIGLWGLAVLNVGAVGLLLGVVVMELWER